MADEEKLDATFYAFKKRDQRFVLTRAAVAYFGLYVVLCVIYFALMWPLLSPLIDWYGQAMGEVMQGSQPQAPPSQMTIIVPYAVAVGIISLVLFAAFEAACLRWLVRGESGGGLLGLSAGADTWRVFAGYFVWLGLFIAFCLIVGVVIAIISAISSIGGPARLVAMLLGALTPLGAIALLLWGATIFAPASATSIARRRFAFFEAPRVVRGYFWQLLGAFIILWVGYLVLLWTIGTLIQLPAQSVMNPVVADMMTGNASDVGPAMIRAMSSPIYLASMGAYMLFSAILSTVLYVAMFGVNARAVLASDQTQPGTPT